MMACFCRWIGDLVLRVFLAGCLGLPRFLDRSYMFDPASEHSAGTLKSV